MIARLLVPLLICLTVVPARAVCTVHEETQQDHTYLVMENDVIKVRVLPAMGGAISDLELKEHGPLLAPGRILREQVLRPLPIYRDRPNGWGVTDWFHPGEAYSLEPWVASIIENTPESCALEVRYGALARTMRIRAGSSRVEITVSITNTSDTAFNKSYWLHAVFQPGGAADVSEGTQRLFVPLAATAESRRGLAEVFAVPTLLAQAPQGSWDRFFAPAQPWMALVDRSRRLLAGICISRASFNDEVVFHSVAEPVGDEAIITQEVIFGARPLPPGDSASFQASLVAMAGLERVDWLGPTLALAVGVPEDAVPAGEVSIPVRITCDRARTAVNLLLVLRGEDGQIDSDVVQFSKVGPDMPGEGKAVFADVPAGNYALDFRALDPNGDTLAEGSLWAKRLVVRAQAPHPETP